jgi:hypothetical protein
MFADALRDGLTTQNPFTGLRLETPKGRKDLTALTEEEIQASRTLRFRPWAITVRSSGR